jgi:glyoxylase-like metal-dependent hydrolase (beta-lactamase superfamily II)
MGGVREHGVMSEPLYRLRPGGSEIRPASQPAARPINDFIFVSEGLSNSYLVVTAEGRVVVNTGMGFEAPVHKRNYDAVDSSPIRYIILTQGHVDHVGGVDLFREPGTEILAHANNPAQQADDARIQTFRAARSAFAFAAAIAQMLEYIQKSAGGKIPGQSRPQPTITFTDEYSFELGGTRFELYWTPGGETTDSLVIWLPQHRICFTGNLFSALFGHFPNLVTIRGDRYREALGFIESLERVRGLEPELLLVGHHGPVEGREVIQRELERLRGAVEYVHDATVQGMNAGTDVHTLMREIQLPPDLEVGQGYGKVSWSVRAIWENYAGWFHHRSTTELYTEPGSSVHPDLVDLAGGPDAIVERADKRLRDGSPLGAIYLAEVVLTTDANHRGALATSLAAHRRLRSDSRNFWESAWLDRQIADLDERMRALP